jgi:hypothetical protein
MKSTIRTEAGAATIEAQTGRVAFNGASMLPHEAALIGSELMRAATAAVNKAEAYAREQIENALKAA